MKKSFSIYFMIALLAGLAIAWMDSRPNWDDTGITVFLILAVAALFGFLTFEEPWLIALAVSIWIPIVEIGATPNYGALLSLLPGFAGAYLGYFIRKIMKDS